MPGLRAVSSDSLLQHPMLGEAVRLAAADDEVIQHAHVDERQRLLDPLRDVHGPPGWAARILTGGCGRGSRRPR